MLSVAKTAIRTLRRHLLNFTHRAEDFLWLEVSLLVGRPVSNDGGGQL